MAHLQVSDVFCVMRAFRQKIKFSHVHFLSSIVTYAALQHVFFIEKYTMIFGLKRRKNGK